MNTQHASYNLGYYAPGQALYNPGKSPAFMDYLRGLSICVWIILPNLVFYFYPAASEQSRAMLPKLGAAGLGFGILVHLSLGIDRLVQSPYLLPTRFQTESLLALFCVIVTLLAPSSLDPFTSFRYGIATWATLCLCHWLWRSNPLALNRMLAFTGLALLAYLLLILYQRGITIRWGKNLGVEGIQRNHYGASALAGAILIWKAGYRWSLLTLGAAFGISLAVSSRGALGLCGIFGLAYYGFHKGFAKTLVLAMGLAILAAIVAPLVSRNANVADMVSEKVLKLKDKRRGLGSGFSGRTERWTHGLALASKSPIVGYGYRTRRKEVNQWGHLTEGPRYDAHSGWINMLLDTGLVGTGLVFVALSLDFLTRWKTIREKQREKHFAIPIDDAALHLSCLVCALHVTMLLYWIFEPKYLSLASPLTLVYMMFISSPRKQTAPSYSQQQPFYYAGQELSPS